MELFYFSYLYGTPLNIINEIFSALNSFCGNKVIQLCFHNLFLGDRQSQCTLQVM